MRGVRRAALRGGGGGRLGSGPARRRPCAVGVPPGLCQGIRVKERQGRTAVRGLSPLAPHEVPD